MTNLVQQEAFYKSKYESLLGALAEKGCEISELQSELDTCKRKLHEQEVFGNFIENLQQVIAIAFQHKIN